MRDIAKLKAHYDADPSKWCEAHWDRQSKLIPVHKLGLCKACYQGYGEALPATKPRPLKEAVSRLFQGFLSGRPGVAQ